MPTRGSPDSHIYTRTYRIWCGIKTRCLTPSSTAYKDYGAKGITVCKRWIKSYWNFLEDMGTAPIGLVIDRIHSKKGYYKANCRWVTPLENSKNIDRTIKIRINGVENTFSELEIIYGIPKATIKSRIKKLKWPIEKAIWTPVRFNKAFHSK